MFVLSLCSHHEAITIDSVVNAAVGVFSKATGKAPRFRVEGGSNRENLALQNIQVWLILYSVVDLRKKGPVSSLG